MKDSEKAQYLLDNGWTTYYSREYWVHKDTVELPEKQDYTDYGLSLDSAYKYEILGRPKFRYLGLPVASMFDMYRRTDAFSHEPREDRHDQEN
jgi:hypothetical protein